MSTKIDRVKYFKTIGICNNGFNGRGFANPYSVSVGYTTTPPCDNRSQVALIIPRPPNLTLFILSFIDYGVKFSSGGGTRNTV